MYKIVNIYRSGWKYYTSQGFSPEAVAAILGNVQQESSFRKNAENSKSHAIGLFQWLGGRKRGFLNYAQKRGKPWEDAGVQFEYAHKEFGDKSVTFWGNRNMRNYGATPTTYAAFKKNKNLPLGTLQFMGAFERPGYQEANGEKRIKYAANFFRKFQDKNYVPNKNWSLALSNNVKSAMPVGRWIQAVTGVKKAVASKNPSYSNTNTVEIFVDGKRQKVRLDCSGMVSAYLRQVGLFPDGINILSANFNNKRSGIMLKTGFTPMDWPGWENLVQGDILATKGHVEVFAKNQGNRHLVWNGGSTPSLRKPGMTGAAHKEGYTTVWRPGSDLMNKIARVKYEIENMPVNLVSDLSKYSFTGEEASRAKKLLRFGAGSGTFESFMLIRPELRSAVLNMAEEYNHIRDDKKPLSKLFITSAWRSLAYQDYLAKNKLGNKNTVADVSKNNQHYLGLAVDMPGSQVDWLKKKGLLDKYGLSQPMPKDDRVHVVMKMWENVRGDERYAKYGGARNYPLSVMNGNILLEPHVSKMYTIDQYREMINKYDPNALKGVPRRIETYEDIADSSGENLGDSEKKSGMFDWLTEFFNMLTGSIKKHLGGIFGFGNTENSSSSVPTISVPSVSVTTSTSDSNSGEPYDWMKPENVRRDSESARRLAHSFGLNSDILEKVDSWTSGFEIAANVFYDISSINRKNSQENIRRLQAERTRLYRDLARLRGRGKDESIDTENVRKASESIVEQINKVEESLRSLGINVGKSSKTMGDYSKFTEKLPFEVQGKFNREVRRRVREIYSNGSFTIGSDHKVYENEVLPEYMRVISEEFADGNGNFYSRAKRRLSEKDKANFYERARKAAEIARKKKPGENNENNLLLEVVAQNSGVDFSRLKKSWEKMVGNPSANTVAEFGRTLGEVNDTILGSQNIGDVISRIRDAGDRKYDIASSLTGVDVNAFKDAIENKDWVALANLTSRMPISTALSNLGKVTFGRVAAEYTGIPGLEGLFDEIFGGRARKKPGEEERDKRTPTNILDVFTRRRADIANAEGFKKFYDSLETADVRDLRAKVRAAERRSWRRGDINDRVDWRGFGDRMNAVDFANLDVSKSRAIQNGEVDFTNLFTHYRTDLEHTVSGVDVLDTITSRRKMNSRMPRVDTKTRSENLGEIARKVAEIAGKNKGDNEARKEPDNRKYYQMRFDEIVAEYNKKHLGENGYDIPQEKIDSIVSTLDANTKDTKMFGEYARRMQEIAERKPFSFENPNEKDFAEFVAKPVPDVIKELVDNKLSEMDYAAVQRTALEKSVLDDIDNRETRRSEKQLEKMNEANQLNARNMAAIGNGMLKIASSSQKVSEVVNNISSVSSNNSTNSVSGGGSQQQGTGYSGDMGFSAFFALTGF